MRFTIVLGVFMALSLFLVLTACSMDHDDVQPYLEDSKIPNNAQWEHDTWQPEDWIESKGSAKRVMDGFYAGNVVTKQYIDDGQPILEVGNGFLKLSGQEKRRVVRFVDHVFKITDVGENGTFHIYHEGTDDMIGMYTKQGLQIQ